jgi:hypothetical protein
MKIKIIVNDAFEVLTALVDANRLGEWHVDEPESKEDEGRDERKRRIDERKAHISQALGDLVSDWLQSVAVHGYDGLSRHNIDSESGSAEQ